MRVDHAAILTTAALTGGFVLLLAPPASAALVTYCTGVAGGVTVPNELVVPQDASCDLQGTTVQGDVTVRAGADLLADGATITGDLVVREDAFADLVGTSVAGSVAGSSQYGVFLESSQVGGDVDQRQPEDTGSDPFVYALGTDIDGNVDSRAGELLLESSTLDGDLLSRRGVFTDVVDSVVGGSLTVRRNELGAVVCESEIYGPAVFEANRSVLQIGGSGDAGTCDGASFWGADVTFTGNSATAGFDVSDNIVAGDLTGEGNDPAPTGQGNRVRGEVSGQLVDLQPGAGAQAGPEAEATARRSARTQEHTLAVTEARSGRLQAEVDRRRGAAEAEAAAVPQGEVLTRTDE